MTETLLSTAAKNLKLKSEEVIALTTLTILIIQVVLLVNLTHQVISLERVFTRAFNVKPSAPVVLERIPDERGHAFGPEGAVVTVVEFSDFQCPYCAQAAEDVKELLRKYPNQVRFVYRHYPLTEMHSNAYLAAQAAECAGEQGRFWEMHNMLFANQENLEPSDVQNYAQELNLRIDKFNSCISDEKTKASVERDINDGNKYGVNGTPTFFVNKTMVSNVSEMNSAVAKALATP
jgi:protein-disulfide isomerase